VFILTGLSQSELEEAIAKALKRWF
jgi:hypothetical protein